MSADEKELEAFSRCLTAFNTEGLEALTTGQLVHLANICSMVADRAMAIVATKDKEKLGEVVAGYITNNLPKWIAARPSSLLILAIKEVRNAFGYGLKDAKDLVEQHEELMAAVSKQRGDWSSVR